MLRMVKICRRPCYLLLLASWSLLDWYWVFHFLAATLQNCDINISQGRRTLQCILVDMKMVEAVTSCQPLFVLGSGMRFRPEKLKVKLKKDNRCHYAKAVLNSKQQPKKDHKKPLTVNLSTTIDAPLYESPEVLIFVLSLSY